MLQVLISDTCFSFLFFLQPLKDLNTLLVSNKHWFSTLPEMMHDFTPSQIISETFFCLLLSALYLWRGFEKVCVVACSAVMWEFCCPAELPSLVQIPWVPSFCSQNLTEPLPGTQRYRRERASESPNLSGGSLYSSWNSAINASLSPVWSPCCLLLVYPLEELSDKDLQLLMISDPVLLPAKANRSVLKHKGYSVLHLFGSSKIPTSQPGLHMHRCVLSTASLAQDIQPPRCGVLAPLQVPADIPIAFMEDTLRFADTCTFW